MTKGKRKATIKLAMADGTTKEFTGYLLRRVDWWERPIFVYEIDEHWKVTDAITGYRMSPKRPYHSIKAALNQTKNRMKCYLKTSLYKTSLYGRFESAPVLNSFSEALGWYY